MRCSYCFDKNRQCDSSIDIEHMNKTLSDIISKSGNEKITINIFGGEITILDNLKDYLYNIYKSIEDISNRVTIVLTSNGMIYSDDIVNFVKKSDSRIDIYLSISYDPILHERIGEDKDTITYNLMKYKESLLNRLSVKVTISENMINHTDKLIDFIDDFKYGMVSIDYVDSFMNFDTNSMIRHIDDIVDYLGVLIKDKKYYKFGFANIQLIIERIINNSPKNNIIPITVSKQGISFSQIGHFTYDVHFNDMEECRVFAHDIFGSSECSKCVNSVFCYRPNISDSINNYKQSRCISGMYYSYKLCKMILSTDNENFIRFILKRISKSKLLDWRLRLNECIKNYEK